MRLQSIRLLLAMVLTLAVVPPASAQVNLVGYWNPVFDEDFLERLPGPEVGDYAGLPITAAARKRANTCSTPSMHSGQQKVRPLQ